MVTNIGADQFPSVIGMRFKGSKKKKRKQLSLSCWGKGFRRGGYSDGKKA